MRQPDRIVGGQRLSAGRHWNPSVNAITDLQARVARLERSDADPLNVFPGYGTLVQVQNIEEEDTLMPLCPWAIEGAALDDAQLLTQRPVLNVRKPTVADLGHYVVGASRLAPGHSGPAWIRGLCPIYMITPHSFLACKRADYALGYTNPVDPEHEHQSEFQARLDGAVRVLWEETVPDPVNTRHLALGYLEGMPAHWVKIHAAEGCSDIEPYTLVFPTGGEDAVYEGAIDVNGAAGTWPSGIGEGYHYGAYLIALTPLQSEGNEFGMGAWPTHPFIINAGGSGANAGDYLRWAGGSPPAWEIIVPADYKPISPETDVYTCPIGSPLWIILAHLTGTNLNVVREIQNDGQLTPLDNFVTVDIGSSSPAKVFEDITLDPLGKIAGFTLMGVGAGIWGADGGVWV